MMKILLMLVLNHFILFNIYAANTPKTLARATYTTLQTINQLQTSGQHHKAIRQLKQLITNTRRSYDIAIIQQQLAYAYLNIDKLKAAHRTALLAINSHQLPTKVNQSLLLLLAKTAFNQNDFRTSVKYAEKWLQNTDHPTGNIHFLAGYAYYQLKRLKPAEKHIKQALKLQHDQTGRWHQLLLSIYMDRKQYHNAEIILQQLITQTDNNPTWWRYLIHVYLQQNKDSKALATLVLANQQKYLKNQDLKNIIQLYHSRGIPDKAARLLQHWRQTKQLKTNYKNLKLQFQLWQFAREHKKAIRTLENITQRYHHAEDYLLLGQLYLAQAQWKQAHSALKTALKNGFQPASKAKKMLNYANYWLTRLKK